MDSLLDVKTAVLYCLWNIPWTKAALAFTSIILSFLLQKFFIKAIIASVEKQLEAKASAIKYLISALEPQARLLIIISGIWIAVLIMDFPAGAVIVLNKFFRTIIAFMIFKAAYDMADFIITFVVRISVKSEGGVDEILVHFIRKALKATIAVIGGISIVQEWYKNIGGLLAGLGLGGLALALAAKDTVANLFGSITIMVDRPFKIGDFIATQYGEGVVEEIGFRSTRIRTSLQAVVTIPNLIMSNSAVTNWSRMKKRRIEFRVSLNYSDSVEQIKEFIYYFRETLVSHTEICQDDITVCLEEVKDNSTIILFAFFTTAVQDYRYFKVREEVNIKIIDKLKNMGLG